jgi:hypothetical protein
MMAYNVYRARTADGEGGWVNDFSAVAGTVYGTLRVDPLRSEFLCGAEEDLRLEDVVEVGGRHYRVLGRLSIPGAPVQSWEVENTDRPRVTPS